MGLFPTFPCRVIIVQVGNSTITINLKTLLSQILGPKKQAGKKKMLTPK
jgi:hypothetical protein